MPDNFSRLRAYEREQDRAEQAEADLASTREALRELVEAVEADPSIRLILADALATARRQLEGER